MGLPQSRELGGAGAIATDSGNFAADNSYSLRPCLAADELCDSILDSHFRCMTNGHRLGIEMAADDQKMATEEHNPQWPFSAKWPQKGFQIF